MRSVVQDGQPRLLVETVAHEVAEAVLRGFPLASAALVRVLKPHVAVPHTLGSLGACVRARGVVPRS